MRRCVLGLLLCVAAPAGPADFYIDPVNGSDTGDGSPANPWRTLQAVIEAGLIETRNWESLPYQPGLDLVTVNAGAPVKAGDTLWLRSGYHGAVVIQSAYNAIPITIAAQPGHVPRLRSLLVQAAQSWVLRGLSISPSHAPPLAQITIVNELLHAQPFSLAGRGVFGLNSAGVSALQGKGGTITVSNDGRYGDLTGKAVALEPATGFSFDSPMVPRPR